MSVIAYQLLWCHICYDLLINKNEVLAQTCQIILYVASIFEGLWLFLILLFAICMLRLLENNTNETIFSENWVCSLTQLFLWQYSGCCKKPDKYNSPELLTSFKFLKIVWKRLQAIYSFCHWTKWVNAATDRLDDSRVWWIKK